jgi:hypothetical protein
MKPFDMKTHFVEAAMRTILSLFYLLSIRRRGRRRRGAKMRESLQKAGSPFNRAANGRGGICFLNRRELNHWIPWTPGT